MQMARACIPHIAIVHLMGTLRTE
ncbi:hypothetical protein EMIT0196MI5_130142 [Pseudomonas sp. IT-196MI5]